MLGFGFFIVLLGAFVVANAVWEWELWQSWESFFLSFLSEPAARIIDFAIGFSLTLLGAGMMIANW